jgi:hypothetical protein
MAIELTATAEVQRINLSWSEVIGATSYNIMRSTVESVGHSLIASVVGTTFVDVMTEPLDDRTYYYIVSAVDDSGVSDTSVEVAATAIPLYTQQTVYIHPSRWGGSGGAFPKDVMDELIANHNAPGKQQELVTQPPFVIVKTYN